MEHCPKHRACAPRLFTKTIPWTENLGENKEGHFSKFIFAVAKMLTSSPAMVYNLQQNPKGYQTDGLSTWQVFLISEN